MEEDQTPEQPQVRNWLSGWPAVRLRGLWGAWKNPATDDWLQSYTVITTDPNELMESIHTRMPVILHAKDYDRWLSREATDQPPGDLSRPFEAEAMTAHVVENKQDEIFVEPNSR